jgi:two-component system, cell cycle sensor histidine kinase and response regulator CckA
LCPSIGGEVLGKPLRAAGGARRTALVVEGDASGREATRRMLERNGFEVLDAGDGPAAVELARRHAGDIDLLLTDAVMPEMPGIELADAILAQHPQTVVVYMSAYAKKAFRDGARPVALIEKPFDEAQLLEVLGRHLPA